MVVVRPESSGRTDLDGNFITHFFVTVAAFCACARFGFVPRDKGDRLEVATCPAMAPVGRTKIGKITACRYCTFQREFSGLFFGEGKLLRWWLSTWICWWY